MIYYIDFSTNIVISNIFALDDGCFVKWVLQYYWLKTLITPPDLLLSYCAVGQYNLQYLMAFKNCDEQAYI